MSANDMIECPYDPTHRLLRKRLQPHLIKCRLRYPDVELLKCPFNSTHLVPEPELPYHVANCPGRALIANYKYNTVPFKEEDQPIKHAPIESEENWDDTEVEDYDPAKYASQAKVIRSHIGNMPSVKKEFRRNERKRLGDCDSEDEDDECVKDKKFKDEEIIENDEKYRYREHSKRTPSPPEPPSWSAHNRSRQQESTPSWYEDTQGGRQSYLGRQLAEINPHEDYSLDEDPYYNAGGASGSRGRYDRGRDNRPRQYIGMQNRFGRGRRGGSYE